MEMWFPMVVGFVASAGFLVGLCFVPDAIDKGIRKIVRIVHDENAKISRGF